MINEISPESRRVIIQYAARENIKFNEALEILICEGIKSIQAILEEDLKPVFKSV